MSFHMSTELSLRNKLSADRTLALFLFAAMLKARMLIQALSSIKPGFVGASGPIALVFLQ